MAPLTLASPPHGTMGILSAYIQWVWLCLLIDTQTPCMFCRRDGNIALTMLGTLWIPYVVVVPLDPLIRLHNVVSFIVLTSLLAAVFIFYLTY